jgi:epimerase transport system membrane fusion protein
MTTDLAIKSDINARRTRYSVSDKPGPTLLLGISIVAVFFGGFGAWAALAPFNSAVVAPAFVRVETNRKTIQHLEGGIVSEILIKDGEHVSPGQVLIRLSPAQPQATHDVLLSQYRAMRAQEARLFAERNGERAISFPAELLALKEDPEVAKILKSETRQFETNRVSIEGQTSIFRQRIAQLHEQMSGTVSQLNAQKAQLKLINDELRDTRYLYSNGNTSLIRLRQLERTAAALEGQSGDLRATIGKLNEQIGETERQIIQLTNDQQANTSKDLREVQNHIFDILPRLAAADDVLKRTNIVSMSSGYVVGLTTFTIGGIIKPGETLLQIIPDRDTLVLEAQVKPEDIEAIRPGLDALVHLTAFKQRLTPQVHGTVTNVAADRLTDQRTGAPYYTIEITIKQEELDAEQRENLYPGMPASISIPFGNRTALDYLIRPLTDSLQSVGTEK